MKTELDFEVSFKCSIAVSEEGRKTIISTVMGTSPDEFDLDVPEEVKSRGHLLDLKALVGDDDQLVKVFMGKFMAEEIGKLLIDSKEDLDDDDHFSVEYTNQEVRLVEKGNGQD